MTSQPADWQPLKRDSPAYRAGRLGHAQGWEIDENPWEPDLHKYSEKRQDWFVGWLDASSEKKFPQHFERVK